MGAGMVGESPFHGLPAVQRLRPVAAAGGNNGVVLRRLNTAVPSCNLGVTGRAAVRCYVEAREEERS